MLPSQLDPPSYVGNAGEKFRQGSGPSNFTHPFVVHAGVKLLDGASHVLSMPLLEQWKL